jgi:hypothetical protein
MVEGDNEFLLMGQKKSIYRQSDSNRYELLRDFLKVMCLPFHHGGRLFFFYALFFLLALP